MIGRNLLPSISCCCLILEAVLSVTRPVHGLAVAVPRPPLRSCVVRAVGHRHQRGDRRRRTVSLSSTPGHDDSAGARSDDCDSEYRPSRQPSSTSTSGDGRSRQGRRQPSVQPRQQSIEEAMALMGTSPRRIFLSVASSSVIALSANLFGVTSNLLSTLPEDVVEKSGLDSIYPRGDYKRVTVRGANDPLGGGGGLGKCSFVIPKEWVADTGLALAQAQRRARALDYTMSSGSEYRKRADSVLPDAAYGPPGRLDSQGSSNGDTNVSVIVNADVRDFALSSLGNGDAASAAEFLLSKRSNPTVLISSKEELRGNGIPVYEFEYTVDRGEGRKPLRAISVVAGSQSGDAFVTLTVVSTEEEWGKTKVDERLRRIAESFKLV